jgi:hypothetical protein
MNVVMNVMFCPNSQNSCQTFSYINTTKQTNTKQNYKEKVKSSVRV